MDSDYHKGILTLALKKPTSKKVVAKRPRPVNNINCL